MVDGIARPDAGEGSVGERELANIHAHQPDRIEPGAGEAQHALGTIDTDDGRRCRSSDEIDVRTGATPHVQHRPEDRVDAQGEEALRRVACLRKHGEEDGG